MRLSLRWKIVGGFGLLLALIVILGWVTLSLFGSLRQVQRRVFNQAVPELIAVDEIVRSYTAQSAAVRGFLNSGSQSSLLDQYRAEVANSRRWEKRAEELVRTGGDKQLLAELETAGHSFQELVDEEIVPLVTAGERTTAVAVMTQKGTPLIEQIDTLGSLLIQSQDRTVARTEADLSSQSNRVLATLVAVIVGALLIGFVLAMALPRRLSADLGALVEATRAIERGDFDQRVDIRSGDEIEELAQRFTEMQAGLRRLQQLARQDRELEIAASIQRGLLQRTLPENAAVKLASVQRQANLVGGDWYDVNLSGDILTVVIGDASGKGIGAALMAAVGLSVLRAERRSGSGPKRVVERANEALREASEIDAFTTLAYASIDLQTGEVRLLNMGHLPPLVLVGSRGEREQSPYFVEGPRNRVLGWFDDPGLEETVLRVLPGDRLVLFTDGFIEAKSPDGEVFGEHRFAETVAKLAPLGLDAIAEGVVADVERFSAGKLDDDLTMLVVEFQGQPAAGRSGVKTGERWRNRK